MRPRNGRFLPPAAPPQVLDRPRLLARVGARPVTVVVGAAGYGKSALVSSWLARSAPVGAVAWLTLDASDRDPGRLAADLLAAGRTTEAEVPLVLVLDDVQQLAASRTALEMVDHLVRWALPSTRVVLLARSVPPLRLQRLRLEDRLELVGQRELAFTPAETADAVRAAGLELDPESVRGLHRLTQGWPAGVRMATLAIAAGASADLPLELRRDDALADYLATEVLGSLDPQTRDFLLEATIDEVVGPALVDAVRGSTGSLAMLERCHRDGLFLDREPGTTGAPAYRWHSLFAAHMAARRRVRPARSRELERRAARWWLPVDPAVAVTHALAAGDAELAGDIASRTWLDLVLTGRPDAVERFLDEVPAGVSQEAELSLARAFVAARRGAADTVRVELDRARRAASLPGEGVRAGFEVRASMVELIVSRDRAGLRDAVERGHLLLAESGSAPWGLDLATLALARFCVGLGEARLLDSPAEAVRLLREAGTTAAEGGFAGLVLAARAERCLPAIATGQLAEARMLAEEVLGGTRPEGGEVLPSTANAHGCLGWLAFWEGDPRRARDLLERSAAQLLPHEWSVLGLVTTVHAQACLRLGDLDAAEDAHRRGRDLDRHGRMPPWWPALLAALEGAVLLARDRVDAALAAVEEPGTGPSYPLTTCCRATVLLGGGRPERALEVLQPFASDRAYPHLAGMVEALRAQALLETGQRDCAHAAVERALAASAAHDLLEPFLALGGRLRPLLGAHLRVGTAYPDLVVEVMTRLAAPASVTVNEWGESLTERETSILRYLATTLSLAEIGDAECISVNTVKTHIAHVYQKLAVGSRRAAVRRASELELF